MARLIEPRTLKGFRDIPPALMIPRERCMEIARTVFRNYGFAPIDTPALEYTEILLAKLEEGAEVQKQLYRFTDNGGRDVALRFDLTVPLARFVSQHASTLGLPFKRYHLGPVWRGENTQAGRYREFMQCDFDVIGSLDNAADVEIALVICDLLAALSVDRFEVRVNNRQILNGLLSEVGLAPEAATPILRALDKLAKVGADTVRGEMQSEAGATLEQANVIIELAQTKGTNDEVLSALSERFADNDSALEGVRKLRQLCEVAHSAGIPDGQIRVDLSICRGLDYYTGTVFETFLLDLESIGSVCSGGRYDDLTGRYTKQALPGVGASLGLDRLLAALEQLKLLDTSASTPAAVLITRFDADRLGDYQRIGRTLRASGIGAEVYPEAKKLGVQLQYAERKGFKFALIAGADEFSVSSWKLKNLGARSESLVPEVDLVNTLHALLAPIP
jgi:histidyl-tRNA synthetase